MKNLSMTLAAVALIITGLIFFKSFLVPIALGLFIASILIYISNITKCSKRFILLCFLGILLLLGGLLRWGGSTLYNSIQVIVSSTEISIQAIVQMIQEHTAVELPITEGSIRSQMGSVLSGVSFTALGSSLTGVILDGILMVVYSFLFVIYEEVLIGTFDKITSNGKKIRQTAIKKNAQYIGSLCKIVGILAILYSIVLLGVGVPYAIVIAVGAAICTFVPTVGTIIGIIIATIATYALTNSFTSTAIVLVILQLIQIFEEYVILPAVAGKKLSFNPLATILLIVVGGVLWGVPGIFLALPIASTLQVVLKQTNPKHWFITFTQAG